MTKDAHYGLTLVANSKRVGLSVGKLPHRKSYVLYLSTDAEAVAEIEPLAYFRSEQHAQAAIDWLRKAFSGETQA